MGELSNGPMYNVKAFMVFKFEFQSKLSLLTIVVKDKKTSGMKISELFMQHWNVLIKQIRIP